MSDDLMTQVREAEVEMLREEIGRLRAEVERLTKRCEEARPLTEAAEFEGMSGAEEWLKGKP